MYGPVRTVVWEGSGREAAPYPDYWDRLIAGQALLAPFRELFGDERHDHAQALKQAAVVAERSARSCGNRPQSSRSRSRAACARGV